MLYTLHKNITVNNASLETETCNMITESICIIFLTFQTDFSSVSLKAVHLKEQI